MAAITVDFGVLSAGADGLVASWGRIEQLLADLDTAVAATGDMQAETLLSYRALKAQWDASAADRQVLLHSLGAAVADAGERYRQVDAAMAAQFLL